MKSTRINFIIDLPLMALTILQGISGILLLVGSNDATYLGISRFEWKYFHELTGISMVILLTIHFTLYWKWLIDETKNSFRMRLFDSI